MRKALRDVVLPAAPEQANGGEQIEDPPLGASGAYLDGTNYAIGRTGPSAAVVLDEVGEVPNFDAPADRRTETWPHDDVRRVVKGLAYLHERSVVFAMACMVCKKAVTMEGRDNGGATLMGCKCAVRRWL